MEEPPKEDRNMLIHVIYKGGKMGSVDQCKIDRLINSRQIIRFRRADGWAVIGVDPIRRINDSSYKGTERRQICSIGM
jgi:hypothetical protein